MASEESYEAVFLLDGSALGDGSCERSTASCPSHHLDSPARLAACCQQVREQCPAARICAFVSMKGFQDVQNHAAELLPFVQWVPLGCGVLDFMLEFARKRGKKRRLQDVTLVSNCTDAIALCVDETNLNHMGFMFVDGELLMPGLTRTRSRAHAAPPPEVTAPVAGRSRSRTRSPNPGRGAESHTLHDSELDGESMEEYGALGDTQIDEETMTRLQGARQRATQGTTLGFADVSFMETQVVEDFPEGTEVTELVDTQPEGSPVASLDSKASRVSWALILRCFIFQFSSLRLRIETRV